jgi:hypothetical protein
MGASEWGKPSNALRAKGVEKEEEEYIVTCMGQMKSAYNFSRKT